MKHEHFRRLLADAVTAQLEKKSFRLPAGGEPIWRAFRELSYARSWHRFGPNPISFTEIEAWVRLTRTPLQPHHVQIIQAMDAAFMKHFGLTGKDRAPEGVKTLPKGSGSALTPALFDAALG